MERFEIYLMTRKGIKDDQITAYFRMFIGKEAYNLLNSLAFSQIPNSLAYESLDKLPLSHVQCASFKFRKR